MLRISIYENDTLARLLVEHLSRRGYEFSSTEYPGYLDPPEDTVVIRSPFSNGWGENAPHQISIPYDLELVERRVKQNSGNPSVGDQYAYRMVTEAIDRLRRRYIQPMKPLTYTHLSGQHG